MINVGKPSLACELCRRRRVKCDLGRPACQRCFKYGVKCPGYRDMQALKFRNATVKVSAASPTQDTPQRESDPFSNRIVTFSVGPTEASPIVWASYDFQNVPPPVYEHWTSHSVPLLLDCFHRLPFFTRMLAHAPANHPIVQVSHVFARTYMVNRYKAPPDGTEVSAYLSKALRSVQTSINDNSQSREDATIVAVWLLSNYEVLIGGMAQRGPNPSAWLVHTAGMTSLLRNRGPRNLVDPLVRQMFWITYNAIQIQSLISNTPCPTSLGPWIEGLQRNLLPAEKPLLKAVKFIRSACALFAVVMPAIVRGSFTHACELYPEVVSMLEEGGALGQHIYREPGDLLQQVYWTSWACCRIKLNFCLILLSGLVQRAPVLPYSSAALAHRRNRSRDETALLAGDIIASLPMSLGGCAPNVPLGSPSGWYYGLRLVYPLSVTYMIVTVPAHCRIAAKNALIKIGRDAGIMQALKDYTGRKRFPTEAVADIAMHEIVPTDGYIPDLCHD